MSAPKSLADDLRRRDADGLRRLFERRADLLSPAPSDMTVLTTRATTSPSISRCLETLDALEVFALSVASEETLHASLTEPDLKIAIANRITEDDSTLAMHIDDALLVLRDAAFVWGDPSSIRVITAARDHVRDIPCPSWPIPQLEIEQRDPLMVDQQAAGAAGAFVRHVHELIEMWTYQPPAVLRSGGLSVRDFVDTARGLHLQLPEAALVIEITHAAGLITPHNADGMKWIPTTDYDTWFDRSTSSQWEHLVRAWLTMPRLSGDADDRRQLLAVDSESASAPLIRQQVLETAGELAPGCTTVPSGVVAVLDFTKPRRASAARVNAVQTTFFEADLLGVMALGGLSSFGRLILEPQGRARISAAQAALDEVLPADVHEVLIQADLTVIAPGPLAEGLASQLRDMADIESRGHGSVYRVTVGSLQRALAHGWTADKILEFLRGISRTPVPQPLEYLITDAARTLRDAPVATMRHRSPAPPQRRSSTVRRESSALVDAVIAALQAGERPAPVESDTEEGAADVEPVGSMTTSAVIAELRAALMAHHPARIGYVEADGLTSVQIVDPMRLGGGSLTAFDHRSEQVRTFSVARITGAVRVD